jgi:ubiquitin-conjugating enzyme E2 variant
MARASVIVAAVAAVLAVLRLVGPLHGGDVPAVVAALPVGLLMADFVSALAHWFGDTYFDTDTPVLGAIVGPFRLHHRDPEAFRRHDFFERNRNNCLVALPLLVLAWWILPGAGGQGSPVAGAALVVAAIVLASATQIHAWAHDDDVPRLVRWLQCAGIFLSPEHHARHHLGPHDRAYGIVNGWTNAVLDRSRFFRHAETLAARLGLCPESLAPLRGNHSR